jgi:uncharacterized protein (TIGR02300 family)
MSLPSRTITAPSSPSPASGNTVTKPELGTKRLCAGCNAKFYDLNKTTIVCPMCQAVFEPPKPAPVRGRRPVEPIIAAVPVVVAPKIVQESAKGDDASAGDDKEADAGIQLLEEIDED